MCRKESAVYLYYSLEICDLVENEYLPLSSCYTFIFIDRFRSISDFYLKMIDFLFAILSSTNKSKAPKADVI